MYYLRYSIHFYVKRVKKVFKKIVGGTLTRGVHYTVVEKKTITYVIFVVIAMVAVVFVVVFVVVGANGYW